MDVQNERVVFADRPIKVEPDEDPELQDENGQAIPCVSTVPVTDLSATLDNNTLFYFQTQAMQTPGIPFSMGARPRFSNLRSMQKWAQKRKTIEALAQGALMNAEEPFLFEKSISHANTKIVCFDTQLNVEASRDDRLKKIATSVSVSKPEENTGSSKFPKIGSCYSLNNESCTTTQPRATVGLPTVTRCATTTCDTPSMANVYAVIQTNTRTTIDNPTTMAIPAQKPTVRATVNSRLQTVTTSRTSNQSSSPPNSLNNRDSSLNKMPSKQTAYGTPLSAHQNPISSSDLRVVPSTPVRPESSKMAVCLPNIVSEIVKEPKSAGGVYIPREIKVGATELRLEECVNVKAICDKELTKWTADDVAKFVRETDCSEYADAFIDQEIDGKALTLLNQDLLIQWMKLKLGPAMKLYSHIVNLKYALHDVP